MFYLWRRVIDWFFNYNLFYFLDFDNFRNLFNNFLNSFYKYFHWLDYFNDLLGRNNFFNFHKDLLILGYSYYNFLFYFANFFDLHDFLYDFLHFNNFRNFSDNLNNILDDFRNLYNFFHDFWYLNEFLHDDCLNFWHLHWNIHSIFYNINFSNLNRNFNSIFNWNKFRNLNNFFNNFLNNFLYLNYFRDHSINLKNIVNVDNIHYFFFNKSNYSFIDLRNNSCFPNNLLHLNK